MAKQSGLGDNLLIHGYNVSGDIGSLQRISGGAPAWDITGINKQAFERAQLQRTGGMEFNSFFNPSTDQAHDRLSVLPLTDVGVSYLRGTALGSPGAACVAKQFNYDFTRNQDGSLTQAITIESNGYGIEWGVQLTAGERTDTGATNGASLESPTGAATTFGAQAYLHVTGFTGTDATIKIQDSADNAAFADLAGGGFTQITGARVFQRIATASNATVRRYLRVATVTTGGFTSLTFNVIVNRNLATPSF